MTERVQFINESDVRDAQRLAREYAQRATGQEPKSPPFHARDMTNEKYTFDGMTMLVTQRRIETAQTSLAQDGTVQLPNGQVVALDVAKANGWIRVQPDGAIVLLDQDFAGPQQKQQASSTDGKQPSSQNQRQEQKQPDDQRDETQKLFAEFDTLADHIEANTSAGQRTAAASAIDEAADFETAAKAVNITNEQMAALEKAHMTNASMVTTEVGLPNPYMMECVLTDEELKTARKAVRTNDRMALRALAVETLRRFDSHEFNKDIAEELESIPGVSVFVYEGSTMVTIPTLGTRSLRSLIRDGTIKYR